MSLELADLLTGRSGLTLRIATVISVASGRATISFGGDNVPGVPFLTQLAPKAGDIVNVLGTGRQLLIVGAPSSSTSGGYQPLTLASGYGTPAWAFPASYRVIGDRVFLAGAIAKNSGEMGGSLSGIQVATSPPEIRPPAGQTANMPCASAAVSGGVFVARVDFESDGRVLARIPGVQGATNWIGLDGLSYRLR